MIINFNDTDKIPNKVYDHCIIGAGLVGIVIANELIKLSPNLNIILLEFGNKNYNYDLSSHIFENTNHLNDSIVSGIGGASNTWSQTLSTFTVDELKQFNLTKEKFLFYQKKIKKNYNLYCKLSNYTEPVFHKYKKILKTNKILNTKKYDLLYNCYAKTIESDNKKIISVDVISSNKKSKLNIKAKNFILTNNSYSIIQLLLNSIKQNHLKVNNSNIGKNISNHPIATLGYSLTNEHNDFKRFIINNKYNYYFGLRFLKKNSSHICLYKIDYFNINLILIFLKELLKKILILFNIKKNKSFLKIPFLFENITKYKYFILIFLNMNDDKSKIFLSKNKNNFNNYFLKINFDKDHISQNEIMKLKSSMKQKFINGKFIFFDDLSILSFDNAHHIGGTAMGNNKKNCVVDYQFKYFGISNLYILSKSIFPISSSINPSYHLLILAMILIDNLTKKGD